MKLTPILNQILLEKVEGVQWLQKSYYFAADNCIPLTPTIAKILGQEKRINVFHITSPKNTLKLKSLEGTKKSISAMTIIPEKVREDLSGIWGNGVMFSIEGTLMINSIRDLDSTPDESGRRWIKPYRLSDALSSKFMKYIRQDKRVSQLKSLINSATPASDLKKYITNKELNEFLTLYIDRSTEFVKEYSSEILESLVLANPDRYTSTSEYDEIIVNQIKLTGAIANVAKFAPKVRFGYTSDVSEEQVNQYKEDIESSVGKENVTYVNTGENRRQAEKDIDNFILTHGGKLK